MADAVTVDETRLTAGATAGKQTADPGLVKLVEGGSSAQEIRTYIDTHPEAGRGSYAYGVMSQLNIPLADIETLKGKDRFEALQLAGYIPEQAAYVEAEGGQVGYVTREQIDQQVDKLLESGAVTPQYAETIRNMPVQAAYTALGVKAKQLHQIREADVLTTAGYLEGGDIERLKKLASEVREKGLEPVTKYVEQKQAEATAQYERDIRDFESSLEGMPDELQDAYKKGGVVGYNNYLADNYTQVGDSWISNDTLKDIKAQSGYGYDLLMNKGYDAYQDAVDDAIRQLARYKRGEGYRLYVAVGEGVSRDTLSLLFAPEDVEKAWRVRRVPEEADKETSVLPAGVISAITVGGVVAAAEPTPIGEILIGTVVAGGIVYALIQGRTINFSALVNDIRRAFKKETGRSPTTAEVEAMELTAARAIQVNEIPNVKRIPRDVKIKLSKAERILDESIPLRQAEQILANSFQLSKEHLGTILEPVSGEKGIGYITEPVSGEKGIGYITEPTSAERGLGMVISQVATAEKDLEDVWVIIRPKIIEPGKYLPATVPTTEKSLVALDEAVRDAYTKGEIDEEDLRIYQTARQNYLTKKQLLDAAMKSYIGGMQPELTSNVRELAISATVMATADLQEKANRAAMSAYNKAISQGATEVRAVQAAKTAALEAVKEDMLADVKSAVASATTTATKSATVTKARSATLEAVRATTNIMALMATQGVATAVATATTTIPRLVKDQTEKGKLTKKELATAVTWPQGFGWWVVYRDRRGILKRFFHKGQKPPRGIKQVTQGKGEAYRGIQLFRGRTPTSFELPMGAVSVAVTEPEDEPGKAGAIKFTPRRPTVTRRRQPIK